MHAAELGDRVVAVLEEHPVVELLGPAQADGGVDGVVAGDVEVADELVEEQPAQALGRAGVAGEERALHHLGQVDQGEHRPVEVGEVPTEDVGLVVGEVLRGYTLTVSPPCRPTPARPWSAGDGIGATPVRLGMSPAVHPIGSDDDQERPVHDVDA